ITPGAYQTGDYLSLIKDKKVALVVNQTSMVGTSHLVDTLLSLRVNLKKVFAPEHGFRGDADAGETVKSGVDVKTNLPIVSLYGDNKKPTASQLVDVDVIIFDIQDVGTRFYTYISTMHYMMEACAENNKLMIILDRPNPNGMYVDGPVLKPAYQSFVGMHPIPVLHGLTVGELAKMINGEGWLKNKIQCDITVIPVKNYSHKNHYSLPVKPSPNLPNDLSIKMYPSLCLFEGTVISVGRGTYKPFQQIGHPDFKDMPHSFTPKSIEGMAKNPRYEGQQCHGIDFSQVDFNGGFSLTYLIDFYQKY
ncbi:exo-beta-N-acetylmuramidase NamZ family protein, partial [Fulvivirga kasyanovii]